MKIRVPGNILLSGEYAVLEPGGTGLALALNRYFYLEAEPSTQWDITSLYPDRETRWIPGSSPFLDRLLYRLTAQFPGTGPHKAILDSRELYHRGHKLGLGSSACTALCLTTLFMCSRNNKRPGLRKLGQSAILAHRYAQAGKGSGYDILTSLHGGWGIFRGGLSPDWHPLTGPDLPLFLLPGSSEISSQAAILKWEAFRKEHPGEWKKYVHDNHRITRLARQKKWMEFLEQARAWGLSLGRDVTIPSEIPVPPGFSAEQCKAVGAGNEIGLGVGPALLPEHSPVIAVHPAPEGLKWL